MPVTGSCQLFLGLNTIRHSSLNRCFLANVSARLSTLVQNNVANVSSSSSSSSSPLSTESIHKLQLEEKTHVQRGIAEFVGTHPRVAAVIKQRYQDFQVHEIDLNGEKVQLTDLSASISGEAEQKDGKEDRKFIHCILYKEDIEHSTVRTFLSRFLEINPNDIGYAGRKDKNAQTSQRVSFPWSRNVQELVDQSARWTKTRVGNFSWASTSISPGHLNGNHFTILLRNIQPEIGDNNETTTTKSTNFYTATTLDNAVKSWKENGFVNYFGLQRFGTQSHKVGIALLQRHWLKAFDLMLSPRPEDTAHVAHAKDLWLTERDARQAEKCIPPHLKGSTQELHVLLRSLATFYRTGKNREMKAVYKSLPNAIRALYVSACSGYFWNKLVSERLKKFGMEVLPGDFVEAEPGEYVPGVSFEDKLKDRSAYFPCPTRQKTPIRALTKEDLVSGHPYSIFDVQLPVLGTKLTTYLNPDMQDICDKLLAEEGLITDDFVGFEEWNAPAGLCRSVIVKPGSVNCKIVPYSEWDDLNALMPSDLVILRMTGDFGLTLTNKNDENGSRERMMMRTNHWTSIFSNKSSLFPDEFTEKDFDQKPKVGAFVEFSLPTSSYATMALREIMQTSNFAL